MARIDVGLDREGTIILQITEGGLVTQTKLTAFEALQIGDGLLTAVKKSPQLTIPTQIQFPRRD